MVGERLGEWEWSESGSVLIVSGTGVGLVEGTFSGRWAESEVGGD